MNNNFKAWKLISEDFPDKADIAVQIHHCIKYGLLAPSTHNTQPWKFKISDYKLDISANNELLLPFADPMSRNLYISLGACAYNIQVAASHYGIKSALRMNQKEKNIQLIFESGDFHSPELFPAIVNRYTEKRVVLSQNIEHILVEKLINSVDKNHLFILSDREKINTMATLTEEAAASYSNNVGFNKELASWMRLNNTKKTDGMPGFTSGLGQARALIGKKAMSHSAKSLKIFAKKYRKLIETSPAVGLLASESDDWCSWVLVGVEYERASLIATINGFSLGPMAAVIENEKYKKRTAELFGAQDYQPQMFFRIVKRGKEVHTPRRNIEDYNVE